jgi:hypothetical protein
LSRLGKTNKFDFALAAPKSPLSKRRCKNTAFFNTVNVFLKKFYINYNLLIFNKKLPSFRLKRSGMEKSQIHKWDISTPHGQSK